LLAVLFYKIKSFLCFLKHEKEFHRHLHTQESKKPLPFTRSLAELTKNRSQKDVTVLSTDQITAIPAQTPSHKG
jgi:hypothetical protein